MVQEKEETVNVIRNAVLIKQEAKEIADRQHTSGEIKKRVVDTLAEEIIKERTDLLLQAIRKRDELHRNLNKIRPDQVLYERDGKKTTEAFSKAKLDELNKGKEELTKVDKLIEKAINNMEYEGLKNLNK